MSNTVRRVDGAKVRGFACLLVASVTVALVAQQHQALRWTYIGSGLRHENFRATLGVLSPDELKRIDALAPSFC